MVYEITLSPENHGYTVRLVERTYTDEGKKEVSVTVETLAIIWNRNEAYAVFNYLNVLLCKLVEHRIVEEDLFRFMNVK